MKQLCLFLLLAFSNLSIAQTVSGIITEANSDIGLIGVNILEKGTDNGTITDIDGAYTITLTTDNPVLEISYIGYNSQEVPVDGRATVDISMLEGEQLDEVVVIGYGTQKKKVVTGAITKVDGEELEDMQVTRLEGALQGRTSGVTVISGSGQPGDGASVRIRGVTGFGGGSPLYIVDGVVIGGGIDYLNPNDIESIEVLKDGASTSIYGTRASGGVILVTTKSGKKGDMKINYNGFYGTQRPWRKLSLLNGTEYATLRNESSKASGGSLLFENPSQYGEGTDWQDAIFRLDAPFQNHDINFSGGGEKSDYYMSFAYNDAQGIVSPDDSRYQRYNFRINTNHKISSRLKIGNSIAYTKVKATGVGTNSEFGSPLSRAINLDPITPIIEDREEELARPIYAANPVVTDNDGQVYGISPYVTSEILNPLAAFQVNQGFGWSDKIVANIFGDFKITDYLTYGAKAGADAAFWGGESFNPIYYLNATNRNDLTSYNRQQNRGLSWILSNTLTFENSFGNHNITALVGASAEKNKGQGISGAIKDIPVTRLEDASLGFANTVETQAFGGFEYESRLNSMFGRISYNYAEKYLFMVSIRRDGSSRFGPNKKYGSFPGLSAGWVLSEEDFITGSSAINFLKIRASYGVNGTDNIGDFRYLPLVNTGSNYTFGLDDNLIIGASPGALSNPDLRWEETSQSNIGFDATIFKHFDITLDLFSKKVTGILRPIEVPGFVGFGSPDGNIGKIDNRGIELELGYENDFGKFNFDLSGNIAYNENEIVFISDGVEFIPGQRFGPQGLEITRAFLGQPIEQFFGYKTDGLFQNQDEVDSYIGADGEPMQPGAAPGDIRFVDIDGDGDIDPDDRTSIGDPTPTWSYGVNLELTYSDFDLRIFGQGVFGNEIYDATRRYDLVGSNLPGTALGRWRGEGTSTDFPRLIDSDPNRNFTRSSDFFVESGAYFRIKNFQIGYTIPKATSEKIGLSKARFYFSANNVITITNYSGFDPEIPGGVDRGIYPQPRTLVFGANITFK